MCLISSDSNSSEIFKNEWKKNHITSWDFPGKKTGVGCISFSRGSSWPRDWTHISCLAGRFFIIEPPGKPLLNRSDKSRHLVSFLILGKRLCLSPLSKMLAMGFTYMALRLRKYPTTSSLRFLFFLIMKGTEFCHMLFLHQLRWSCNFFPSLCYYGVLHWFSYVEPSSYSRVKSHLVMAYNPFNVVLNSWVLY